MSAVSESEPLDIGYSTHVDVLEPGAPPDFIDEHFPFFPEYPAISPGEAVGPGGSGWWLLLALLGFLILSKDRR